MSLSISMPTQLSFSKTLTSQNPNFLSKLSQLSLQTSPIPRKTTIIRMGGGPRTYPGGVSKWQWKRMQAKKGKQLLKARLCRERQIYEMRKRAELKAAVSELERPWEVIEKAPTLFSVKADDQVKVLADRFQKPGGFDLWSERDGPQLFETPDGLPSARFFPKGVVHSVRPYGKVYDLGRETQSENGSDSESGDLKNSDGKWGLEKKSERKNGGRFRKQGNRNSLSSLDSGQVGLGRKQRERGGDYTKTNRSKMNIRINQINRLQNSRYSSKSEVFDMSLEQDSSYGFQAKNRQLLPNSRAPE